jgi:trigger factor
MSVEIQPVVRLEEPEPGHKKYSVEVPEAALREAMEEEFRDLEKSVRLPGFREGKAPRSLVEARFRESVRREAVEKLVSRVIWQTLRAANVVPFFDPEVHDLSAAEGEPIRFGFTVDAWPRVELRKVQGFELRRRVREVADPDRDAEMRAIQEAHVRYVAVPRAAIRGDQLVVSYQRFREDGSAFGKRVSGAEVVLSREESEGVSGTLEKGLLGALSGQTRSVAVDFPPDHPSKPLAGRKVEFRFEVQEVRERMLPPVDDALATRVLEREATAAELEEKVREALGRRSEEEADRELDDEILGLLLRENPVEIPPRVLERVTHENLPDLPREEDIPPEKRPEVARQIEALIEERRKGAARAIQKLVLLTEIASREKLEPEEREIEALRRALRPKEDPSIPAEKREEERERFGGEIRRILRERKVLHWIRNHSTVA